MCTCVFCVVRKVAIQINIIKERKRKKKMEKKKEEGKFK